MKRMLSWLTFIVIAIFGIWLAWGALGIFKIAHWLGGDIDRAGQWGDAFGAINALFAGLAFSGVLATLWMQREQLASQQQQISRAEREQHLQRFDSTFFQLLALLRDLRGEVRAGNLAGTQAFRHYYKTSLSYIAPLGPSRSKDDFATMYASAVQMDQDNPLGPFFRIVYSILRRISEDSRLTESDKARYGNLVRSHLSTEEVGLIGLNGLTADSNDFSNFITEFRILKYLPENALRTELERFYPHETFSARD